MSTALNAAAEGQGSGPAAACELAWAFDAAGRSDHRKHAQPVANAFTAPLAIMLADLKLSLNPERVTLENPRPELKGQIAPEVQARLSIVPKGNTNITNRRFREGLAGGGLVFNHGFRAFLGSIVFAAYILVVFFF